MVPPPCGNMMFTSGNLALAFLKRMFVIARVVSKGYSIADAEMPNVCGIGLGSEGWTNIVAFLRFNSSMRGSRATSPKYIPLKLLKNPTPWNLSSSRQY